MTYRPEIDGMRAIAVILVVLFHADISFFSGGYIGVDVFFVISGYLITTIILHDLNSNQFRLANFYERRIRRIIPVLLVVITVTYVLSWWLFLPQSHKDVGQFATSSILSASNILLYLKGHNYFGLEEESNPLFHTWSLGVEEQYYLFIPLLLILLSRGNWLWYLFFFIGVFVSSLLATQMLKANADFVFYLIFTRAWELAAGSLVALCMIRTQIRPNNILAIIGFILVLYAAIAFNESKGAAGTLLVIPVMGSAMMILFTSKETLFGKTLSLQPVVFIGLMSYSLYLWHIPILVFYRYLAEQHFHLFTYTLLLFLLSYASWRFVEKPFRRRNVISMPTLTAFIFSLSVLLITLGVWGHKNGGFPERNAFFAAMKVNNGYGLECNGNSVINAQCSSSTTPTTAVLGNSYSMVLVTPLAHKTPSGVVQLTQDSCAIGYIDHIRDAVNLRCGDFFTQSLETILTTPSIEQVVISSNFDKELSNHEYEQSFGELLLELSSKDVIVVGPPPSAPKHIGQCLWKEKMFNDDGNENCDFAPAPGFYQHITELSQYLSAFKHVTFIDLTSVICPEGVCKMALGEHDAMYTDTGHLSYSGSATVIDHLGRDLNFNE